jgi:oligoribonuclease (3'-5' exoribonuclease)
MLYVSIDIETTGLDPETCDVVEFAATLADTTGNYVGEFGERWSVPTFHRYVVQQTYRGEPYALSMHAAIFRKISVGQEGPEEFCYPATLGHEFRCWLREHGVSGRVFVAGKNFSSFDLQFLKKLPGFKGLFHHRTLDPVMLYFDPKMDEELPDLATCKARAGLPATVAHTALEDALDVVKVLTAAFNRGKDVA